ncbi:YhdP family protein [Catenovulum maritimum]|uniref:YhdP central domain-containing protein n=1 Tax=Catenovulum maritimum TaxID=1513271 RepID=A0A0J8GTC5_9ALTE|nr:YhdP family protein [Catenovulum maritimum]KMT63963.1 hypothetical protein XM47_16765 [Catenovulum maritimum]
MVITRLIANAIRHLWLSVAFILVFFALTLSAIRVGLPYANEFKTEIATWFENEFEQPIQIGQLNADWQNLGPTIQLSDFQFISLQESQPPILIHIEKVDLEIDFWQSITKQDFIVSNFVLDGVDVLIDLEKLKTANSSGNEIALLDLLNDIFLSKFKRFDLQNSQITLITRGQTEHIISVDNLNWFNQGNMHQGVGQFSLEGLKDEKLAFILSLKDSGKEKLTGQFYTQSDGVDFSAWLKPFLSPSVEEIKSNLAFESWLHIENSQLKSWLVDFKPSQLSWNHTKQLQSINLDSGRIQAIFDKDKDNYQLDQLQLSNGDFSYTPLSSLFENSKNSWKFNAKEIDLRPLQYIAPLFELPELAAQFSKQIYATPKIANLHLWAEKGQNWKLSAEVAQLKWRSFGQYPEMDGLTGKIIASPDTLVSDWIIEQKTINWPVIFEQPLEVNAIQFQSIFSYQSEKDWLLKIPSIDINLAQTQGKAEVMVRPDPVSSTGVELAVFAEIGQTKVKDVPLFLPRKLMGDDTFLYLEKALVDGNVQSAELFWQGNPSAYPFQFSEGIFKSRITTENATFAFQPNWPAVNELALELTFYNDGLFFYSEKGKMLDAKLVELNAQILALDSKSVTLELDANLTATGQAATEVMQKGSLKDSVGKTLEQLTVTGDLTANLELNIPLHNVNELNVRGDVLFNGNELKIEPTGFVFQRVNGLLEFDMDKLSADKLTFDWGSVPYQVDLNAKQGEQGYLVDLDLRGNWPLDAILTQSRYLSLADRVKGTAQVNGHLAIKLPKNGFSYRLDIASDLHGVNLDLPQPFNKSADIIRNTNFTIYGDMESSSVELKSANDLRFKAVLPHDKVAFSRAYLVLGSEFLSEPAQGFNISAYLEQADLNEYLTFISDLNKDLTKQTQSGQPIIGIPQRIRGKVDSLTLGPLNWHSVNFDTSLQEEFWRSFIIADEFKGNINAHENLQLGGLEIEAERLWIKLATDNKEAEAEPIEQAYLAEIYQNLPPIKFNCRECKLDEKNLGQVKFLMLRDANEKILLKDFSLKYREHQISANGSWLMKNKAEHETKITGHLSSKDFGHWLRDYQLSTVIRDSSVDAKFNLNWPTSPLSLSNKHLNGDINWTLGQGYLAEVSDKGTRILSLLSIDSLVRKLKLDFRDVFSKGFFYNGMKGDVKLTNGLAYTNNTRMDGVPGNIDVSGNANLVTQEIDYQVQFSPKVTSSLPIIIAWMVNPVTGIAALAIDQALESADVISQIKFSITGTIDNPRVVETGRESKEIKLKKIKQPATQAQPKKAPQSSNNSAPPAETKPAEPTIEQPVSE